MHKDLETRRLVLLTTYRRYLEADRAWTVALAEVRAWFPNQARPYRAAIGDPGSPVRQLWDRRERALLHLEIAREKLEEAKRRLAARHAASPPRIALVIRHPDV